MSVWLSINVILRTDAEQIIVLNNAEHGIVGSPGMGMGPIIIGMGAIGIGMGAMVGAIIMLLMGMGM
jgi:hypothetical protein